MLVAVPFPLAHPAAVLPLRRVRFLSLGAMMIGSLTPDVGYLFSGTRIPGLAHSVPGSFMFCLPIGLVGYAVLRLIREPLAAMLPSPHRQAVLPHCRPQPWAWWAVIVSTLLGAWSHIALDALTHESQMLMAQFSLLQEELALLQREGIRVPRVLWTGLSVAGIVWLLWTYARFLRVQTGRWAWFGRAEAGRYLALGAVAGLPLIAVALGTAEGAQYLSWRYLIRYHVYHTLTVYLVVISALILAVGLGLRLRLAWIARAARSVPAQPDCRARRRTLSPYNFSSLSDSSLGGHGVTGERGSQNRT
jgi:hypothetical protein